MKKYTPFISIFLATNLEVSTLIWGYLHAISLYQIPLLLAAYHAGYLICSRIPVLNWRRLFSFTFILSGISLLLIGFYLTNIVYASIGILILSTIIQQLKQTLTGIGPVKRGSKFIAKMLGIVSSIIMVHDHYLLLLVFVFTIPLLLVYFNWNIKQLRITTENTLTEISFSKSVNWIHFFHHLHYFLFCYIFWHFLELKNPIAYGPLFILGWIGYYIMEKIFTMKGKVFRIHTIGIGHFFSGVTILLMLFSNYDYQIFFLWFITGFGGGTIYMLNNLKDKKELQYFEDWSHVLGCGLAALIIYFTSNPTLCIVFAVVAAFTTSVISILDNRKIYS